MRGARFYGPCAVALAAAAAWLLPRGRDGEGARFAARAAEGAAGGRAGAAVRREVYVSPLAGSWYPASARKLRAVIKERVDQADDARLPTVAALLLPHAGYRWSGAVAAHGIRQIMGRGYRRVVVLGPSHHLPLENVASVPAFTHLRTPLGEVELDLRFIRRLKSYPGFTTIARAHQGEHSVQIEVPLLQYALGDFQLVPIVVGRLDQATAVRFARVLRGLLDARTLVVASSDFTHYGPRFGYVPFKDEVEKRLRRLNLEAYALIERRDVGGFYAYLRRTRNTICGRHAIAVLLGMLPASSRARLLADDASGRVSGDFSESVSYLAVAFTGRWKRQAAVAVPAAGPRLARRERLALLCLARAAIAFVFSHHRAPTAGELGYKPTSGASRIMGAFVTLKKDGRLRGCIGEITPIRPLYRAVIAQAVNAAFRDPRFAPLRETELERVRLEISALTPSRPVASCRDIVLGRHGIVIEKQGRRAVYLPQVAPEQGWDLSQTLSHLARKAGLPADAWKQGARFTVFEAEVFSEPEKGRPER